MSLSVSPNAPSQPSASQSQPSTESPVTPPSKSTKPISRQSTLRSPGRAPQVDDATWGSNFWVTLVDPQSQTSFFACPATGQVSWDPPVGTFVLPPSEEGEWWELSDESRGGLPYYYQTKTGETVWERPNGFVIPLSILQNSSMSRRLSQTTFDHFSKMLPTSVEMKTSSQEHANTGPHSNVVAHGIKPAMRRSISADQGPQAYPSISRRHNVISAQLTPIPGSPNATDTSATPSLASKPSIILNSEDGKGKSSTKDIPATKSQNSIPNQPATETVSRARSKSYTSHRPPPPQSLDAALEILSSSQLDTHSDSAPKCVPDDLSHASSTRDYASSLDDFPTTPTGAKGRDVPPSPTRPVPDTPRDRPTVGGKGISNPVFNHAAMMQMSPVKNRTTGKPIAVETPPRPLIPGASIVTLESGGYPMLPQALASDIQLFSESDYAKQYFSTHRSGFIFKRKVPVAQLMTWQKSALTSPLLVLNRSLHKDAVKIFKVIQHIMGDREREKPVNVRLQADAQISMANASTTSLSTHAAAILEEERWLLGEGLKHGEMRDEIYCQLMKQLTGNPSKESVFKGWQLLCVLLISFPPSKNFEAYLQAFIQKHTAQSEGRVDVMAKYCLRRLASISKKGPRGKPPSMAEIEIASDAAFNPSTFGESLDAIIRLQERNYPHEKVPIILPFLADGVLALGGTRAEGIFRVPGDNDSVSALKLRIDRGYYTLDGIDDPHVLASLMKLWLRELCDPLVPEELYNECIQNAREPEACVQIVERLPTINRRVVLFVISFLQLFLEERTQSVTKMTPANLALVMAPNLLRCNSDSMSVVFTNAQYEQIFVYNLLLHLRCDEIDNQYKPVHGRGAVTGNPIPKKVGNRSRRREIS